MTTTKRNPRLDTFHRAVRLGARAARNDRDDTPSPELEEAIAALDICENDVHDLREVAAQVRHSLRWRMENDHPNKRWHPDNRAWMIALARHEIVRAKKLGTPPDKQWTLQWARLRIAATATR